MGTRGHLGGLAEATLQAALVLDAAGKELLFLETVGAGQSEVEVITIADTVLLVLMPGLGRLDPGAEGGDHGDPRRDRRQQVRPPGGEDDGERGALDPRTGHRAGLEAADRPHRGRAGRGRPRALGEDRRAPRASWRRAARSPNAAPRTSPARSSPWRARAPSRASRTAVAEDEELRRLLGEVQRRELDPLSAVREIMERVFKVRDGTRRARHSLRSRRRGSASKGSRARRR